MNVVLEVRMESIADGFKKMMRKKAEIKAYRALIETFMLPAIRKEGNGHIEVPLA